MQQCCALWAVLRPLRERHTCPELRFPTSLLEKGPWGLQAANSEPLSSLGTLGQVGDAIF